MLYDQKTNPRIGGGPMKFDLHLHTTRHSPDSQMGPLAMCRRARRIGLDGVVITEHDWLWTEPELEALRELHPGLVVLSGIEVSAREGHFLVYGVTDPFALPRGIGVAALCREVHRQGGAVVAAHPFRWGQPFRDILRRERPELDGLELMTNNMDADCRRQAAAVQAELGLTGLGSSDAHEEAVLGFCYTDFPGRVASNADLVEAIRSRRAQARERKSAEALA
jgi:predicted metal-dependent phosphoesterase TrpH